METITLVLSTGERDTLVAALDTFADKLRADPETIAHDPEHFEEVAELRKKLQA